MNNTHFIKGIYLKTILVFSLLLGISLSASPTMQNQTKETSNWFELIMQRIQERHKAVNVSTTDNTYTKYYMSILSAEGAFPDINYADQSQTNWNPLSHLDRMKYMVLSYTIPSSTYYQDETLYNHIVNAFTYWYNKHPLSTNWYNQQIASPQRLGVMLILMRSGAKQLPATLENNLLSRMESEGGRPDQSGSQGTGANKLDIATHWVYRGCLQKNESVLSFGAEQVYYPIFMTTDEGLQHDLSYQQHGNQIHIGAYGFAFVDGISSIAAYMTGTPYEMSKDKLDYLSQFTRKAYVPMIRGQYFMYNVVGRAISRKGSLSQSGFHTVLTRMKNMDPQNATEYNEAIERLKGNQPASYAIQPENRHFWRADYTLHQRPEYTFDVRGATGYTTRNENGNNESLKGYFLVDGATELVLTGKEYVDIFGVWDWTRIPGTTTPVMTSIPLPKQWGQAGSSSFAGSASDGLYGVSTYLYNDTDYSINTSAKKSWFMFDDEIVALGSDIKSTASQEINTTVNQTLLLSDVWVKNLGGSEALISKGKTAYTNLQWVHHNNVGYYFPKQGNINLSNEAQSGAWSSINTSQSTAVESKDVFKLWLNHGVKPTAESYEYILLPNIDRATLNTYNPSNIEVVYNNSTMQAVIHKELDILGIVFYKAATYSHNNIEITVDKPCVVMFRNISTDKVDTYLSDPSRASSKINLTAKFAQIRQLKGIEFTLPTGKSPYAGATRSYTIDNNSPIARPVVAENLVITEDAWVRDGTYADQNVGGTSNTLIIKKDGEGYNREAYLKFDLSGIDPNEYQKYLLQLVVSNSNTNISETRWNIGYVSDDSWSEKTITWNNKPLTQSIYKTVATVSAGNALSVDITELVVNEIKNGNKILTLHISSTDRTTDGKGDAQIYSKEASNAANRPQLILQQKDAEVAAQEITPIANSWVRDGASYENANYYPSNTLTVKNDQPGYNREAYMMFDISNVDKSTIKKVSLRLSVSNANTSISQVYWGIKGTDTNWTESSLTYANRPENMTNVISTEQGQATNSYVYFDLTSYIKSLRDDNINQASFLLYALNRASDGKGDAQFYSKEYSNASKRPSLIIEYDSDILMSVRNQESFEIDDNLSVYPNPISSGETLYVNLPYGVSQQELSLYDSTGRCITKTNATTIATSGLNPGIYVLKIGYDGITVNKKIIIK